MQGHHDLLAMRARGVRPTKGALVLVSDENLRPEYVGFDDAALLWIGPRDRIDSLDLRCLVGMKAVVVTDPYGDMERAREVARRCSRWADLTIALHRDGHIVIDKEGERPWQE
jgi:hypothetical protein